MNIPNSENEWWGHWRKKELKWVVEKSNNGVFSILQNKNLKFFWGIWGAILALFLAHKGFETKDVIIHIDGFEWSRGISIDSIQRLSKSDWAENIDASIYQTQAFYDFLETRRYDKATGESSNHNPNYCDMQESPRIDFAPTNTIPIQVGQESQEYCKYVDFKINSWIYDRSLTTSGTSQDDPAPYWPNFSPKWDNYTLWSERESWRSEKYTVQVSYNNREDSDTLEIPQGIWESLSITSECKVKASSLLWINIDTIDWEECH